eukprot:1155474-Pelagomonas_calceolata.AAC.7
MSLHASGAQPQGVLARAWACEYNTPRALQSALQQWCAQQLSRLERRACAWACTCAAVALCFLHRNSGWSGALSSWLPDWECAAWLWLGLAGWVLAATAATVAAAAAAAASCAASLCWHARPGSAPACEQLCLRTQGKAACLMLYGMRIEERQTSIYPGG